REGRRVGPRQIIAAEWIGSAFEEGHHRPTLVIGLLNEYFTQTIDHQAPDVARSPANDLEAFSVRREPRQLGLVVVGDVPQAGPDLRVVERALRHQNPTARRARELVWEQVRVLDSKTGQHRGEFVRAPVLVGVLIKTNLAVILDERAVFVGQQTQGNGQSLGKGARFLGAGRGRRVKHERTVAAAAGE